MPIKTFRGSMAHDTTETVPLHTNNGSTGYQIKKLDIINSLPATTTMEGVLKIYSVPQSTVTETIDFEDQTLLACGYFENNANTTSSFPTLIVFDNVTFNQDIYITFFDGNPSSNCNYYIELEQVKLDMNENTVATLKDIRNKELRTMIA